VQKQGKGKKRSSDEREAGPLPRSQKVKRKKGDKTKKEEEGVF